MEPLERPVVTVGLTRHLPTLGYTGHKYLAYRVLLFSFQTTDEVHSAILFGIVSNRGNSQTSTDIVQTKARPGLSPKKTHEIQALMRRASSPTPIKSHSITPSDAFRLCIPLRTGLLLLLLPQSEQTNTRHLDDLESDTGNITLGLALTTETGQENLVVLVDEVQATVVGD